MIEEYKVTVELLSGQKKSYPFQHIHLTAPKHPFCTYQTFLRDRLNSLPP
jgi:hypothetical protein